MRTLQKTRNEAVHQIPLSIREIRKRLKLDKPQSVFYPEEIGVYKNGVFKGLLSDFL